MDADPSDCVHLGTTAYGTPVDITRTVAEAARKGGVARLQDEDGISRNKDKEGVFVSVFLLIIKVARFLTTWWLYQFKDRTLIGKGKNKESIVLPVDLAYTESNIRKEAETGNRQGG